MPADLNVPAVCTAAAIESFYRSALNSALNRQLTGIRHLPLFPSMHVQAPARIAYITGFKWARCALDRHARVDDLPAHLRAAAGLAVAFAPGVIMTPVSSVLEACNARVGTSSLVATACRGIVPRGVREVVFGLGLNQVSERFEARFRERGLGIASATALGSVCAGVVAGYFSHVPHTLSTLKMVHVDKSYAQLFAMLVDKSAPMDLQPSAQGGALARFVGTSWARRCAWTVVLPKGLFTRTVQICGSFAILNGVIHFFEASKSG